MKRSEINTIMRECLEFLDDMRFHLPPFATWTPADWRSKGPEVREIVDQQLGWDITDFGSGDFHANGLFLFTLRNGTPEERDTDTGKTYAEKIMIVREGQITPIHYHFHKMEDIIVRGGGGLELQLWNAAEDDTLDDTTVEVSMDGVRRTFAPGERLVLEAGESISLPTRLYHTFTAVPGRGTVLMGEVSRVNDDHLDNRFLEPIDRFAEIEEDEEPLYLLVGDYEEYYGFA